MKLEFWQGKSFDWHCRILDYCPTILLADVTQQEPCGATFMSQLHHKNKKVHF